MRKPDRPKSGVIFRCAIYTRKSSDDGLDQEFNSRLRFAARSGPCHPIIASASPKYRLRAVSSAQFQSRHRKAEHALSCPIIT